MKCGKRSWKIGSTTITKKSAKIVAIQDEGNPKKRHIPNARSQIKGGKLGKFELVKNAAGTVSVRDIVSGEIMHSVSDPVVEARALYVEQSALESRAKEEGPELVIWDVGLGAGTNAMQLLLACENAERPVKIVSFENDLDAFRLAIKHQASFPSLWHEAPEEVTRRT